VTLTALSPRRARRLSWAALALALVATGGAPAVRRSVGGSIPTDHPRAALLPFENLSGREEQAQLFSKVFFAQIAASGAFEMVDPTRVDEAMDSLGVRASASMSPAQLKAMADTLHVPYLLLGSVLESDSFQNENNAIPTAGAALRLIEPATGRVLWAGVHFRSGQDRETVFGWGRVRSVERLVSELASEMLRDFREAGARHARQTEKGKT
jgi:TolB-like protein